MDKQITQLETKMTFLERLLQELNGVVISQQKKIDLLEQRVKAIKDQSSQGDLVKDLDDEDPPPHY